MIILGLTGSIGMGKTTTAKLFAEKGVITWSADESVHALYSKNGKAVAPIAQLVPDAVVEHAVDRKILRKAVEQEPHLLKAINEIVHPLVAKARADFLRIQREAGKKIVLCEIPLLFETGLEGLFDYTIVATTGFETQKARVLSRPSMNEALFEKLMRQQMPDLQKRERADFIVDTKTPLTAERDVQKILSQLPGTITGHNYRDMRV